MRGDPSMNSYNHYAYGAVAEWMYRYAAGVDTVASDAGLHTIALHPNFDARLGHLEFTYESAYGPIASSWKVTGGDVAWEVTVPTNTTARLPVAESNATSFTLNGKALGEDAGLRAVAEGVYELPAGRYSFKAKLSTPSTIATH